MSFKVADVLYAFKGDLSQYNRDLQTADDQARKTGQSMGQSLDMRKVFDGVGVAVAGVGAVVTAHLVDMDNAMAKFKGDTGATAAEVVSAQGAVEDAYRKTLAPVSELGDTLAKLRTDMGLSQDQANALLVPFQNFAEVAGTTGPDAVKGFDDILDAFDLTADQSQGIMDKLVASHQKYGGSITENMGALSAMAPQLKALNLNVDDGIGLLNLFASKGLDASSAQRALNQAVQNLPPGTSLNDYITHLAGIADPGARAADAVTVFGAKAGVAMANALGPGVTSLDQFKVSMQDSAGATDKAADDINSSIQNRIQMAIRDLTGMIGSFASQGGPVLTGIGAVVTGITAIGDALGVQAGLAAARWALILGPLVLLPVGLLALKGAMEQQTEAGRKMAAEGGGGLDSLVSKTAEYERQLGFLNQALASQQITQSQYADAVAKAAADYGVAGGAVHDYGGEVENAMAAAGAATRDYGAEVDNQFKGIPDSVGAAADEMANRWSAGADKVVQSGTDMDDALLGQFKGVQEQARYAGEHIPSNLSEGITTTRQEPLDAFNKLVEMLKHPMSETAETARLIGELTGKKMAEGLTSADPEIRKQAQEARDTILARLNEIVPSAGTVSKKAMDELVAGMKSKDAAIRGAATGIYETIQSQLALKDAKLWAQHAAESYAQGFASRQDYLAEQTRIFLAGATRNMVAASPPKEGPLHEIDVWAKRTGLAWVDAFIATLGTAPGKVSLTLADVKAAFDKAVSSYSGVGPLMPAQTPEAQRAALQGYITSLEAQLSKTYDPSQRNDIEAKIAEYQARMDSLVGKAATASEVTAQTLQGYISNLDKALLTETDPAKYQEMLAKLIDYRQRLDTILNAPPPPDAPDPNQTTSDLTAAKLDSLELAKNDLTRQKAALSLTDEAKAQNSEAIKAIDAQLAVIQGQEDQINASKTQVGLLQDQVDHLKAAGVAQGDMLDLTNQLIEAQKTLNGLVGGGGAGTPAAPAAGGSPPPPGGPGDVLGAANAAMGWVYDPTTGQWSNVHDGQVFQHNYPDAPGNKQAAVNGGPTGGIHVDTIEINNPVGQTSEQSLSQSLRNASLLGGPLG